MPEGDSTPPIPPQYFSRERKTKNLAERTQEGDTPTNEAAKKFHFSRGQHEAASMGTETRFPSDAIATKLIKGIPWLQYPPLDI